MHLPLCKAEDLMVRSKNMEEIEEGKEFKFIIYISKKPTVYPNCDPDQISNILYSDKYTSIWLPPLYKLVEWRQPSIVSLSTRVAVLNG